MTSSQNGPRKFSKILVLRTPYYNFDLKYFLPIFELISKSKLGLSTKYFFIKIVITIFHEKSARKLASIFFSKINMVQDVCYNVRSK